MPRPTTCLPALAAVLLLSGCAAVVLPVPGSGAPTGGPWRQGDVTITGAAGGPVDRHAHDALADLGDYWTGVFPDVFGQDFRPLAGGFFSVDPDDLDPVEYPHGVGCGQQPLEVENNAYYCQAPNTANSDSITYDRSFLAELADGYGQFLPDLVMAHEFGHAVQARVGAPRGSIAVETQADCLAGSWTRWVAEGESARTRIGTSELDDVLRGYLLLRDPVGTSSAAQSAHGSYFDRVSAFQEGFDSGPTSCRDDFGPGRPFTQTPFTRDDDFQNQGNAPFREVPDLIESSLPEFWSGTFHRAFGTTFDRPAVQTFRGTAPDCADADRDLVYCPDSDVVGYDQTDLARPVYALGDFAVVTAAAIPYALAVRDQLGLSIDDQEALRSAICLTGWYAAGVFDQTLSSVQISPGDLDESVQFLLTYGNDPDVLGTADLTGFQLVDLFRAGFFDGGSACDVGV